MAGPCGSPDPPPGGRQCRQARRASRIVPDREPVLLADERARPADMLGRPVARVHQGRQILVADDVLDDRQRAHAADQQRTADRDALAFDVAVAAPARAREERVGRGAAGRAARRRKRVAGDMHRIARTAAAVAGLRAQGAHGGDHPGEVRGSPGLETKLAASVKDKPVKREAASVAGDVDRRLDNRAPPGPGGERAGRQEHQGHYPNNAKRRRRQISASRTASGFGF